MAKTKYYHLDTGFFPQIIKLCFSDVALQQVFQDNLIGINLHAFDKGEAETITINSDGGSLIVMVFDLANYAEEEDDAQWIGVISHEVSHAVEKLGHFIGEEDLCGETRAYLTQYIVEQVYKASLLERKDSARKADRSVPNKKRKTEEWPMSEMDLDSQWGSGQNFDPPKLPTVRRTKNAKGRDQSTTEDSVSTTRKPRLSGRRVKN